MINILGNRVWKKIEERLEMYSDQALRFLHCLHFVAPKDFDFTSYLKCKNQHLFRVTWIVASSHVRSSSILKCLLHFLSCFHRCDVLHLREKGAYISNLL